MGPGPHKPTTPGHLPARSASVSVPFFALVTVMHADAPDGGQPSATGLARNYGRMSMPFARSSPAGSCSICAGQRRDCAGPRTMVPRHGADAGASPRAGPGLDPDLVSDAAGGPPGNGHKQPPHGTGATGQGLRLGSRPTRATGPASHPEAGSAAMTPRIPLRLSLPGIRALDSCSGSSATASVLRLPCPLHMRQMSPGRRCPDPVSRK